MKAISVILLVIAIIVMIFGGLYDLSQKNFVGRKYFIQKEFLWAVAIFLLLAAILCEISALNLVTA